MKNSATYYFLLLASANAWLTWFYPKFTTMMMRQWKIDLEGQPLPTLTSAAIRFQWWPVIFLVGSIIGMALAIILKDRGKPLLHAVIALLLLEGFAIFWVGIGYAIPQVTIITPLRP